MPVDQTGRLFGTDEVFCGEKKVVDADYYFDVFDEFVNVSSNGSGRSKFPIHREWKGTIKAKSGSLPLNTPLILHNLKLRFQMTSVTSFEVLTET
jgi:hypothetical protein